MDLYEEYEPQLSSTEASCIALADELLKLKDPEVQLTFVDINVETPAAEVLEKLRAIKAGELLVSDNEQLALESNGEYYPILDFNKGKARLNSVGLRVSGWDRPKYFMTDKYDNPADNYLAYPSDEKLTRRKLEISFFLQKRYLREFQRKYQPVTQQ